MLGRIGIYRLEAPLGRGGMGEVFLAWDERLERQVAIKRIRHDDAELPAHLRDRFRREARMAARLSHPSIVQIHDLVTDEGGDAIVMEYVEGATLAERLAAGPLETEEALRLARQIAEGLAAAHEAGLIHRDLKAENVIVTRSGQAKILDFGLARPLTRRDDEPITHHGAIVGTCHAMSPEQASGEELDERTDLFSFGVLLYQMLTGRLPFRGKNPLGTLKLVMTEQPTPLSELRPDLPAGLSSLVEQLLAKDRNQRPQSASDVARKLERLEQGLARAGDSVSEMPTYAYPVVPQVQLQRSRARRRRLVVLWGTLLVVVAATALSMVAARTSQLDVKIEDSNEFLQVHRRIESGTTSFDEELDNLDRIILSSPGYLDAQVLAVKVACKQFESTRNPDYQKKAYSYLEKAQKLDPDDPLTLKAEFTVALMDGKTEAARAALARLKEDDPDNLFLGYQLDDSQGHFVEAEKKLRDAIKIAPSWKKYYWLADLMEKLGRTEESRKIYEELLEKYPHSAWVKQRIAYRELLYGEPKRAEQIFGELNASNRQRLYFINIGMALSLQGNYLGAKEAYTNALQAEPESATATLNLADMDSSLGNRELAKPRYEQALKLLDRPKLSPQDALLKAQCLVHLGRIREAKETVKRAMVPTILKDPQVFRDAALVYCLADEISTAREYAKEALGLGLSPYWFELPAFAPLQRDPEFQLHKVHAPSVP